MQSVPGDAEDGSGIPAPEEETHFEEVLEQWSSFVIVGNVSLA
jgi:hypothetical protein